VTGQEVAFLILAAIGGLAGVLVVTSRNVVHAALYLVVALSSVAGVYLLLAAPFVAFVQVIIYVGAIVVLLLFGIMLTRAPVGRRVLGLIRPGDVVLTLGAGDITRVGPELVRWLRASGAPALGLYGVSLGGYTAALLAALEDQLAGKVTRYSHEGT